MTREPHGTPQEVAEYLNVKVKTLRNWRSLGIGPPYVGRGRGVRYPWSGVEAFDRARTTKTFAS